MRIEKLLKQLKREFIKVNFIQACLDSLLFFLSGNLVLFFFSIEVFQRISNAQFIAVLSLPVFVIDLYMRSQKYRLEIYEEKNPELREVLRTARDNLGTQNIGSQALFEEVMDRARSVTSESIIPNRTIIEKILAVGALSFLTVISGVADLQLQEDDRQVFNGLTDNDNNTNTTGGGNFTLSNSSKISLDKEANYSSEIDFNLRGGSSSEDAEVRPYSSEENIAFESSTEGLGDNEELAREYSVAIRNLQ